MQTDTGNQGPTMERKGLAVAIPGRISLGVGFLERRLAIGQTSPRHVRARDTALIDPLVARVFVRVGMA